MDGLDADLASVSVSPQHQRLAPGQGAVVVVELTGTERLRPKQSYEAALVVEGLYEQRVPLRCFIEGDPSAVVVVSQGEFPTRLRAHHWYDHFQCAVPCAEAEINVAKV